MLAAARTVPVSKRKATLRANRNAMTKFESLDRASYHYFVAMQAYSIP
jgi:hypothetical protein